jgi:hypothetical protein
MIVRVGVLSVGLAAPKRNQLAVQVVAVGPPQHDVEPPDEGMTLVVENSSMLSANWTGYFPPLWMRASGMAIRRGRLPRSGVELAFGE